MQGIICPTCGKPLGMYDEVFQDWQGDIFACSQCVKRIDAQEWATQEDENEQAARLEAV